MVEHIMDDIRELFFKYLDGELQGQDARALLDWANASPEHKEKLFSFKETYFALNAERHRMKAEPLKEWKKLSARIKAPGAPARRRGRLTAVGIAASLVIGLLGGWFADRLADRAASGIVAVATGIGQRAEATLPDGSKVTLDPCSRLTYSVKDWTRHRDVSLQGEGVFEVVKNPEKPFTVGTADFRVQVRGTVFKLSAYADEAESSVILKSGLVRMLFADAGVDLAPGDCCIIDNRTKAYRVGKASETDLSDWKSDELRFEGQMLNEMTGSLYRHFGYTFVLSDAVKTRVYKATVRDESLQEFLEILEAVTPRLVTRIDKESRTVYLSLGK